MDRRSGASCTLLAPLSWLLRRLVMRATKGARALCAVVGAPRASGRGLASVGRVPTRRRRRVVIIISVNRLHTRTLTSERNSEIKRTPPPAPPRRRGDGTEGARFARIYCKLSALWGSPALSFAHDLCTRAARRAALQLRTLARPHAK